MVNVRSGQYIFMHLMLIFFITLICFKPASGENTMKEEKSPSEGTDTIEEKTEQEDNALIYGEFYFLQTVSTGEDHFNSWDSIGFEAYKKFTGETGDWGEGDIQFRMTYSPLKNMIVTPMSANFPAIGQPILHNAFINLKGNMGRSNIKIGHFDVPFGVEPDIDTHPTLLQTLHMYNFGYVKDWGISLNGQLEDVDYEAGFFTGTGNDFVLDRGAWLVSGRVTNPTENDFRWGVSAAGGRTLREDGKIYSMWRAGFDTEYFYSQWTFKGEVYGGQTEGNPSYGVWGEADYMFPGQNLELELQFQRSSINTNMEDSDTTALIAGLTYRLSESWSFRTAYSHYFNLPGAGSTDQVGFQLYFYGKSIEDSDNEDNSSDKY